MDNLTKHQLASEQADWRTMCDKTLFETGSDSPVNKLTTRRFTFSGLSMAVPDQICKDCTSYILKMSW